MEKIGLEAFVDTSKFKPGFAEYVSGMDKMIFGTNRLSETMEETAKPSATLANKITDLGNKILVQQKQLDIYNRELEKMATLDKANAVQVDRKRLQIERLTNSINQNARTLGTYRQQVEASQQGLQQFEQEAKEAQRSLSTLDVTIGSFAGNTLSGLFQGALSSGKDLLVDLGREAFNAVAAHEQLTLAIETLTARELINTGQAESMNEAMQQASGRSQDLLKWIEELAVKSPFTSEDIAATFKLAQAYGFTSAEAQRLTQTLTDFTAGAGLSSEVGERAALALGQIAAKGKVSAQELNQLRETGLNVNAILEGMGFNLTDVEKGLVRADAFIASVVQTLERDFQGAAARQTESWQGLVSTLEDTKKIALREFFQGTFDAIQPLAADFVATLSSEEFKASLREAGTEFGKLIEAGVKITQDIDWEIIGRGLKIAAEAIAASDIDKFFNPAKAAEAAAQLTVYNEAIDAAVISLGQQGLAQEAIDLKLAANNQRFEEVEQILANNTKAAQVFNATMLGTGKIFEETALKATKEAEKLSKAVPNAGTGGGVEETFGVSNELTSADVEKRDAALEKLGDTVRDYNEKIADSNKKAIEASQDFADKERELQGDLAQAWQEQNAARANAAIELSNGLIEAEDEYNQAAIEIGQERLEADRNLNQSRLEADQEFNTERTQLESDFNQAVAEIGQQRLEAEDELNIGRQEAQAEALAALAELEREHSEEVFDINRTLGREIEDFNRERLRAEEEFNRERGELETEHADKVKELTEGIKQATEDSVEARFNAEKDLQERLLELEDKRKDKLGGIQEEIDEILGRRKTRGLDSEKSLSKQDQKRLEDLRKQLAKETEEFDKQQLELEQKAEAALEKEQERNTKRLTDLQEKLAEENAAYTAAIEEQDRKYAQQEEDRKLSYDRAVEDLTLRLERENAEFDRQRTDIQAKLGERLGDLQASYDEAIGKLDQRLATERTKLDEQRAALQVKYQEELIDIQQKHDEAVGKLDARLASEREKLAEQRTALQGAYQLELADIDASYAERVATIRQKLEDVAVAHAEKQLELREQMKETKDDFAEKIGEIGEAWGTKAMDETQRYAEYLAKFQNYLSQTKFPINFEINLPDFLIPGSPSPLELSLMRTKGLLDELNTISIGPALSPPMVSSPPMLSPVSVGGPSFSSSFGDIVLQGGIGGAQDARNLARQGGLQVESQMAGMLMDAARRQKGNYRSDFGVRT